MIFAVKKTIREIKELYSTQNITHKKSNISIEMPAGYWLINGKKYCDCNFVEKASFHLYITGIKDKEILKLKTL